MAGIKPINNSQSKGIMQAAKNLSNKKLYHLMNTVCDTPSVYSCAIDSFIELCFYNLFPVLNNLFPYMTNFCHLIYDCSQKYKLHISAACPQMNIVYELLSIEVRQPIWEVIQTNCISFSH